MVILKFWLDRIDGVNTIYLPIDHRIFCTKIQYHRERREYLPVVWVEVDSKSSVIDISDTDKVPVKFICVSTGKDYTISHDSYTYIGTVMKDLIGSDIEPVENTIEMIMTHIVYHIFQINNTNIIIDEKEKI